jgi:predicted amidohydrolase
MGSLPGLGYVDLDLDTIMRVREQIPVHTNRRTIPSPFIAG